MKLEKPSQPVSEPRTYPEPPRPSKPRNLFNAYPIKVGAGSPQGNELWKWRFGGK